MKDLKKIVEMQFGSHVYGTSTENSDLDIKGIFIPSYKDIILQTTLKNITTSTKSGDKLRNTKDDIDTELFSVKEYLKLLCEGQTVALDMLFTPKKFYRASDSTWEWIQQLKKSFLSKNIKPFFNYARHQAAKYGVKGSRIAAVRLALGELKTISREHDRLEDHWDKIEKFVKEYRENQVNEFFNMNDREFINIVTAYNEGFKRDEIFLEVCGRRMEKRCTVKHTAQICEKILDNYGERAKQAETNEGIDWKALSHALRVGEEAKELLLTGNITFPRPDAKFLLDVKLGKFDYKQVADNIEQLFIELTECESKSILQENPDYKFAEEVVFKIYGQEVWFHYSEISPGCHDVEEFYKE